MVDYTRKELITALHSLVKKGYLKRIRMNHVDRYVDSDKVRKLLQKGKTRKHIAEILEEEP